jgi:hypothetical protein
MSVSTYDVAATGLTRAVLALATLAVLGAGVVRTSESRAAIPEPTATMQAALAQVCVRLGQVRVPMTEPLRVVCAAAEVVYTNLLTDDLRNRLQVPSLDL